MAMTLAQVQGSLDAVESADRSRLRQALIIARGAQADVKGYKSIMKSLEG